MPGIGLGLKVPLIKGEGFSPEYQAVYDSFTTKPSAAIAAAQNTMVAALVDAGVWVKLDVFYLFAQTTNGAGEALKNWFNPGTFDATLVNAPAFVALEGFTSDGATSYINCNWNPNTNAINLALDDASLGLYIRTDIVENKTDVGCGDGAATLSILATRDASLARCLVNDGATLSIASTDARGMSIANRTGANVRTYFKNKTPTSDTQVSISVPNAALFALCNNFSGGPGAFSTKQNSMVFAGSSFSQQNVDDMTDAVEVYMDSNGKGVI